MEMPAKKTKKRAKKPKTVPLMTVGSLFGSLLGVNPRGSIEITAENVRIRIPLNTGEPEELVL